MCSHIPTETEQLIVLVVDSGACSEHEIDPREE